MAIFLSNLEINKNQLIKAVLQNSATQPADPVAGQVYFDTSDNHIKVYSGTAWEALPVSGEDIVRLLNSSSTKIKTSQIDGFNEALGEISMSGADIVTAINGIDGDIADFISADKLKYLDGEENKTVQAALKSALDKASELETKYSQVMEQLSQKEASGAAQNAQAEAIRQAKEYADQKVADLVDSAPAHLDTLKEIATKLGSHKALLEALEGAPKKFSKKIGDGTAREHVVQHDLNTRDVSVLLTQATAPYSVVLADIDVTDENNITVKTAQPITAEEQLNVTVVG